jgi:YbbR domain-containing protein
MRWRRRRLILLLVRNRTLKLFSLAFACGLWLFVNYGERDAEKTLVVPVELRNLPPELLVLGKRVEYVDLRVSGPGTLLSQLNSKRITLDLIGVRPGPSSFRINAELLSLPRGVKALRISPSVIDLEIAHILKRRLPVRLDLLGKPPYGYTLGEIEVTPNSVEVTGPAPLVEKLEAVVTDRIDLSQISESLNRDVPLREPEGELVTYSLERVHARIEVQEAVVMREFRRVKIAVKNAAFRAVPTPFLAEVAVRGPQILVEKLRFNNGEIFVDASGLEPGVSTLPVTVVVPPRVEVVSQDPTEVELRLIDNKKKSADPPTAENQKQTGE